MAPSPQSKITPPTAVLPVNSAQTYGNIHPTLLLCLFAVRFRALVDDSVSALLSLLPLVALLQVVYVVLCLPPAGRSGKTAGGNEDSVSRGRFGKAGPRRKTGESDNAGGKIIPALLSLTLPLFLGTPILAILLVLFGAPFTTHIPHTLVCAAHMALLSGTGLVYIHGTDSAVWREIWGVSLPFDMVWGGTVGVGLGAWLGAVPIPLDWDRPWQAYPITIITGAYIGYPVGSLIGKTRFLYGKRIQFLPPDVREAQNRNSNTVGT